MGSSFQLSGVDSATPVRRGPPVLASERVYAFFGKSALYSRNRTRGGAAFANIGAGPSYFSSPSFGRFTPDTATIRSPVTVTNRGYSFAAVFRRTPGAPGSGAVYRMIGNRTNDGAASNVYIQITTTGIIQMLGTSVGAGTDTQATIQTATSLDNWRFICGYLGNGGTTKAFDLTEGLESSDGGSGNDCSTAFPSTYLSIGQGVSGTTRQMDLAFAGIWVEPITIEHLQQVRLSALDVLADEQITGF